MFSRENILIVGVAGGGSILAVTFLHLGIFAGAAVFGMTLMSCFL